MFSSNHLSAESAAAARRRHRPTSRPSSRTQHRQERSGSNASMSRSVRESSVISQRGVSGSFTERELFSLGKAMTVASARGDGKNMDGGAIDWVCKSIAEICLFADILPSRLKIINSEYQNCPLYRPLLRQVCQIFYQTPGFQKADARKQRTLLPLLPLRKVPTDMPSFFLTPLPTFGNTPHPILFRTHSHFRYLVMSKGPIPHFRSAPWSLHQRTVTNRV